MRRAFYLLFFIQYSSASIADDAMSRYQEVRYRLADTLTEMYLFPKVGERYATAVRANGELDLVDSDEQFAERVTKMLQAIHADGHLEVIARPPARAAEKRKRRAPPPAIEKAEKLTPEIAYLKLIHMPGDAKTLSDLSAFLNKISGINVLIIDVRRNFGGGLLEIDTIFSELYSEETPLLYMDLRIKAEEQGYSSLEQTAQLTIADNPPPGIVRRVHSVLPSKSPALADTKVFVLTSNRTPSAAEHLVLALKRTNRAEIVGSTTAGLGHFGETIKLDDSFIVFVPIGATIDPDTGEGWEGRGVSPNVTAASYGALFTALKLAGVDDEVAENISRRHEAEQ